MSTSMSTTLTLAVSTLSSSSVIPTTFQTSMLTHSSAIAPATSVSVSATSSATTLSDSEKKEQTRIMIIFFSVFGIPILVAVSGMVPVFIILTSGCINLIRYLYRACIRRDAVPVFPQPQAWAIYLMEIHGLGWASIIAIFRMIIPSKEKMEDHAHNQKIAALYPPRDTKSVVRELIKKKANELSTATYAE